LKEKLTETKREKEEAIKVHNNDVSKLKEQENSFNELHTDLKAAEVNIAGVTPGFGR
jgi:hypothetical protein